MAQLKEWRDQKWVRIGRDGSILGECGTSPDKKNPDRCLPRSKALSLSKKERAATAKKKKREGAKGKQVVKNTKKAVVKASKGGTTGGKMARGMKTGGMKTKGSMAGGKMKTKGYSTGGVKKPRAKKLRGAGIESRGYRPAKMY